MSCYVGEAAEGLEKTCDLGESTKGQEPHSPILSSLHLRHGSFSNPVASPTSQPILQSFHCFTYVTWRAAHVSLRYNLQYSCNIIVVIVVGGLKSRGITRAVTAALVWKSHRNILRLYF